MKIGSVIGYSIPCVLTGSLFLTACVSSSPSSTSQAFTEYPTPATSTQTTAPSTDVGNEMIALGYYTGSQESYDSLMAFSEFLDLVSVDVYGLDFEGTVVGVDEFEVVSQADLPGIDFYACISNWNSNPEVNNFDPQLAKIAILDQRQKVIEQLVSLAVQEGYAGVNIDFENLAWSTDLLESRQVFSAFIHELVEQLHQNNKKLIISVAAKVSDDPANDWSYPFDLETLGRDADYLQLMTYDQHGPWGDPGPISGADWVEECLDYTTTIVDPEKLLVGLPAYGYDWNLDLCDAAGICETTSFAWKEIPAILDRSQATVQREFGSESPFIIYMVDGQEHSAWFEDQVSLQAKVRLIPKYQLAGLSVWALGMDDLHFWQIVTD